MEIGLYRDDGLAVLDQTPQKIEKIKEEICKVVTTNNLHTKNVVHFSWHNIRPNHREVETLFTAINHFKFTILNV